MTNVIDRPYNTRNIMHNQYYQVNERKTIRRSTELKKRLSESRKVLAREMEIIR